MYSKIPHSISKKESLQCWDELRGGSREALNKLFRNYYSLLNDYGSRFTANKEVVKDGIQKLFLRLWKRHERLSKAESVESYLLISLRRILLRKLKSQRKRYERNKIYLDNQFSESFVLEDIAIKGGLGRGKKIKLLKAINSLNGRQKEALFLRYYNGLVNKEIAKVMGINIQSVRNHLYRAIKSLRTILDDRILE